MKSKLRIAGLVFFVAACGSGDGPAGSLQPSEHPVLATCERYAGATLVTCTEFRNITDEDWSTIAGTCAFQEDAVCSSKLKNRGACRVTATTGMSLSTWHYDCGTNATDKDCARTPSQIQADCQAEGGTYVPPDEAG